MKRKTVIIAALLCVLATAAFAQHPNGKWGIGIQGGGDIGNGWDGGLGLTLKVPSLPVFWTGTWYFGSGYGSLTIAGDIYLFDKPLVPSVNLGWYLGLGAYAGFLVGGDDFSFWGGLRVPVGLSWRPADFFELYIQLVPHIGLVFLPGLDLEGRFFSANLGLRFWL